MKKKIGVLFLSVVAPVMLFAGLKSATKAFTTVTNGPSLLVPAGKAVNYVVTGSTAGLVDIQKTENGGISFEPVVSDIRASSTTTISGTFVVSAKSGREVSFRVYCSTINAGTITAVISEAPYTFQEIKNPAGENMLIFKNDSITLGATTSDAVYLYGIPVIPENSAPRTNIIPPAINAIIRNSTSGAVCIATGTTSKSWALLSSTGTDCN